MTALALLYAGAAYTCALGAMLIAAGLWIHRHLARHTDAELDPRL